MFVSDLKQTTKFKNMKALILTPLKKYRKYLTVENICIVPVAGVALFTIIMFVYHLLAGHFHTHIAI